MQQRQGRLEGRLLRVVRWLALTLMLTTCQLDELITTPKPPEIPVASVQRVADTAAVGSASKHTTALALSRPGDRELSWIASTAAASGWLTLSVVDGVTPSSIVLTLDPSGLAVGAYSDTVIIARSVRPDAAMQIPVAFRIQPCDVVDIDAGAVITDALSDGDCGAPHRPDHFAKLFRVRGNPSDSVSIELTSGTFATQLLINATPDPSSAPLHEISDCHASSDAACIDYVALEDGSLVVEVTTASTHTVGDFTLQVQPPRPPYRPTDLQQLAADSVSPVPLGGSIPSRTILMSARLTDPDAADPLTQEIELRPTTEPLTGQATNVGAPVMSGEISVIRVTDLPDDTDYHWQARTVDGTGRVSPWSAFGNNQPTEPDFHVNFNDPPGTPSVEGQYRSDGITPLAVGGMIDEQSVVLSATLHDDDQMDLLRLEVEVRATVTPFSNTATASSIAVPNNAIAEVIVTNLADETGYHWQARAVDLAGQQSAWLPFGSNSEADPDFRVSLPASQLFFASQPADAIAGSIMSPVVVEVRKPTGQVDETFSGQVNLSITPGTGTAGATLSGTTSVAAVQGIASFVDLSVDRSGSSYRLTAVTPNLPALLSTPFNVLAPPGDHLAVTTQPSGTAPSGAQFQTQPRVAILDNNGNPVALPDISITGTIASGPPGQLLGNVTLNTSDAGAVQFLDLAISGPAGTYTLRFADSENRFTSTISAPIAITGSADHLVLTVQPSNQALSGSPFAVQPEVALRDVDGNPVNQPGISIAASVESGPSGMLLGVVHQTTSASGVARFGNLAISGPAGRYTLRFADADGRLMPAISTSIDVTVAPGPADPNSSTAVVPAGRAGTPTIIVVTVRDASGNGMTGGGQSIVASVETGSPNAGAAFTVADTRDSTYILTYVPRVSGTDVIDITLNGTAIKGSPYISVVAAAAPILVIRTQPSALVQPNKTFPQQPVLELRDQWGNPVMQAGVAITASLASGNPELRGTLVVLTDASGIATYRDLQIKGDEGPRTLQFSATGMSPVVSNPIEVMKGKPGTDLPSPTVDTLTAAVSTAPPWPTLGEARYRDADGARPLLARPLDLAPTGKLADVLSSPEGQRLNRHRRLTPPRTHQTAPVADEEIPNVVRTMVFVHD